MGFRLGQDLCLIFTLKNPRLSLGFFNKEERMFKYGA